MSKVLHGAGRRKSCASCHSTNENWLGARKSSSRVVAETTDTKRKVVEKQAEAASLSGRGHSIRREKYGAR